MAKISPPSAGGGGSVPGRGAKIPDASVRGGKKQNITQKHYCNKLKTLKMVHVKNLKKKNSVAWKSHTGHLTSSCCLLEISLVQHQAFPLVLARGCWPLFHGCSCFTDLIS